MNWLIAVVVFILIGIQNTAFATRVALLADPQTNAGKIAALLEAKLSDEPEVTLVERQQIEQIIREQQLQVFFAADAIDRRLRLGQLLQADVLVLLRTAPGSDSNLEIVVCETHYGLRLLAQISPLSDDPQADAAALALSINAAIDKSRQKISSIAAAPPLVCNDLSFEFSYLGSAYARLIEQSILNRQGAVVAELTEARAIEHELQLGDRTAINRPLPMYILGDYTNDGIGAATRVSITIAVKQGDKELMRGKSGPLLPSDVPAFLQAIIGHLLKGSGGVAAAPADAKTEAKLLADRAHIHQRLGDWDEALNLLEASLLLNPDQIQLHFDAINILHSIRFPGDTGNRERFFERYGDQWILLKEREFEHLEPWFRATRAGLDRTSETVNFLGRCGSLYFPGIPARFKDKALELDRRKRELYFAVWEARLKAGETDFYRLPVYGLVCIGIDSLEEGHQVRLRAIRLLKDAPDAPQQVSMLLWFGYAPAELEDPSFDELLKEAGKIDTPGVRLGIKWARRQADENIASLHEIENHVVHGAPGPPPLPAETPEVIFQPLALKTVDEAGRSAESPEEIMSWLTAGKDTDAIFSRESLFLMKERGKLRRIFESDGECFRSSKPSFDGKYLWAPVVQVKDYKVLVIDPARGEIIAEFSKADGLPPMTESGVVVGLEPGRACASGGFGRGWIASLQLGSDGVKKIGIFFEAKDQPDRNVSTKQELHTAFDPTYVYLLRGEGADNKRATRILIGRNVSYQPLVVDPDAQRVEIFDYPVFLGEPDSDAATYDGQLFTAFRRIDSWTVGRVIRYALPDMKPTTVCQLPAFGPITFADGRVHVLAQRWMTATAPEGPYAALTGNIPGHEDFRAVFHSCFYGLVLVLSNSDRGIYAVEIPKDSSQAK